MKIKHIVISALILGLTGCSQPPKTGSTTTPAPVATKPADAPSASATPAEATPTPQATTAQKHESGFSVGQEVVAPFGLSKTLATIQSIDGEGVTFTYTDDTEGSATFAEIVALEAQEWKVGEAVQAKWTDGNLYPGKIKETAEDGSYVIIWDDGSPELTVESIYIIPVEGDS
jgi:hypothetical protein